MSSDYDYEKLVEDINKLEMDIILMRKTNRLLKQEIIIYTKHSHEKLNSTYHYAGMYYQEKERNKSIGFKELFTKKISTMFPQLIPSSRLTSAHIK